MKKILATMLTFVMILQAVTLTAFADGETPAQGEREKTVTRNVTYTLKGGTIAENKITSVDGNLVAESEITNTENNFNSQEGYVQWNNSAEKRLKFKMPNFKLGSDRTYQFSSNVTNVGDGEFKNGINVEISNGAINSCNFKDGKLWVIAAHPYAKIGTGDFAEYGWGIYGPFKTGSNLNDESNLGKDQSGLFYSDAIYIKDFIKKVDDKEEHSGDVYQDGVRMEICSSVGTAKPRFYDVTVYEKVAYHRISATQNDNAGSVKLSSNSLNFNNENGKDNDNVEIANGGSAYVEDNMTAKFDITAPAGKVIYDVVYTSDSGSARGFADTVTGKESASVSVDLVKVAGEIDVTYVAKEKVKTRTIEYTLKDGTVDGNQITSKNGDFYVKGTEGDYFDAVNGCATWNNRNTGRFYLDFPNYNIGSARKYKVTFKDMGNVGTGSFTSPYVQHTNTYDIRNFVDNSVWSTSARPWGNYGDAQLYIHGWGVSGSYGKGSIPVNETADMSSSIINIIDFAKENSSSAPHSDDVYQKGFKVEMTQTQWSSAKPVVYKVVIEETVKYHSISATQNDENGSVKLSSDTLNFGTENENVEIAGKSVDVEDRMTAKFDITAPAGKVIEKVTYKPENGSETDLSGSAKGKGTASISISLIKADGTLDVEYKSVVTEPSINVATFGSSADAFSYTSSTTGETVNVPACNSICMYAKMDKGTYTIAECGFYLTKVGTDATIKLNAIAVPEGLQYGIRAFGEGIDKGTYSAKAYIVKSTGEEIVSDSATDIEIK